MERDDTIAEPAQALEQETAALAGKKTRRLAGVRIFSSASDAPRSRRPTDGLLLAIAGGVVLSFSAPGPTAFDTAASDLVAQLPGLAGGSFADGCSVPVGDDLLHGGLRRHLRNQPERVCRR
jgi:hypothetical protein